MKTVFNGTPHAINIIEGAINIIEGAINIIEGAIFNPTLRKYVGGSIVLSIPSNGMLNAKINTLEGQSVNGIPTFEKCFSGVGSVFLKNFPMGVLGF